MTVVLGVAVAIGVAVGLARGGSVSHLGAHRLRGVTLLVLGAGLQAAVLAGLLGLGRRGDVVLILVSYAGLAVFAALNLLRPGMGILFVGVLLNAIPIAVDRGMPVEKHAIVAAGVADAGEIPLLDFGNKRHLAGPTDDVRLLDDRLPDWVSHQVLSVGDLVITVGVAAIVAGLLEDPRRRPRRTRVLGRHARPPDAPSPARGRHARGATPRGSAAGSFSAAPFAPGPHPGVGRSEPGGTEVGGPGTGVVPPLAARSEPVDAAATASPVARG
jgi:hypothetical protein